MIFFGSEKMKKIINLEKNEREYRDRKEELELEKGDGLAIFLSAIRVFGPVILCFVVLFFVFTYLSLSII